MTLLHRRATDLIPFDVDQAVPSVFEVRSQRDIASIVNDLEDQLFTGAIRVSCSSRESRGAALLLNGRVVGCVHRRKTQLEPVATEESLKMLLSDCEVPNTQILKATLRESIVLPMSALFLGYPIERNDSLDGPGYLQYSKDWFLERAQTACIAISFASQTLLEFVHKGEPVGTFEVDTQRYSPAQNKRTRGDYLVEKQEPELIECSILPLDVVDSFFGFRLTKRRIH